MGFKTMGSDVNVLMGPLPAELPCAVASGPSSVQQGDQGLLLRRVVSRGGKQHKCRAGVTSATGEGNSAPTPAPERPPRPPPPLHPAATGVKCDTKQFSTSHAASWFGLLLHLVNAFGC